MMWQLLVSAIVGLPFVVAAGYTFTLDGFPEWASAVVLLVGLGLLGGGTVLTLARRFPPSPLVGDEEIMIVRHPSMKPAYARMLSSIPFFLVASYLFEYTFVPYVYPFVFFVLGLFLFFQGAVRYWVNHFTTYYVTRRRVIHVYKFLWLHTSEIPVTRVVSISEARNIFEILTGRGSVIVASGFGRRQNIQMHDIDDPTPVAEAVRKLLPE